MEVVIQTYGNTVIVEEYISTERVELIAPSTVNDSQPISISLINENDRVSYQITTVSVPEIHVEMTTTSFDLAAGEQYDIEASFTFKGYGDILNIRYASAKILRSVIVFHVITNLAEV